MAVAAAATSGSAYLVGQVINQAYVDRNLPGIMIMSIVTLVVFSAKGAATYGHSVILTQIRNAILANNQRRMFHKLMNESIGFFSQRHSSEFLARLTAGANSVTEVLTLLINAVGRDLLSLIGLVIVFLPDLRAAIVEARTPYIEAAFDVVRKDFGGPEAFAEKALALDASARERLKADLLE